MAAQHISRKDHARNDGMAMILALIFLVGMAIMVTALVNRTWNQTNHVTLYEDFEETLEGIESGFAMAMAELNGQVGTGSAQRDGLIGVSQSFDLGTGRPTFADQEVTPLGVTTMPNLQFYAVSYDWTTDGVDNNGDGTVDGPEEEYYASIYAYARNSSTQLRMGEMLLSGGKVNIWQNAIFAGAGQGGGLINGNVSVYGSVHLLGDNLNDGDIAVAAIDLSGTSLIHNNYYGMPAHLRLRIPNPPTVMENGVPIETLNAKLRVKNGLVGLSGNSEVGQPNNTSNTLKESMDGVFVNDGWTGNALDANGDPISVYSDNGWDEGYELGNAVPYPTFADDGGRNHLQWYLETDADTTKGLQEVYDGDLTIPANQNFYWNATTGTEAVGESIGTGNMPAAASLNPDEYYVWFDAAANQMMVNGRIPVDGNISFARGSGNDGTIYYTGKGTFLAYDADSSGNGGDISIATDLLTKNANGTVAGSFPQANLIGMQAQDDLILGTDAQLEVMGGFYAQDEVVMNKQTKLIGTIVGKLFNLGTNVPDIYQVPELANQWADVMRMIGNGELVIFAPLSWRELGVS